MNSYITYPLNTELTMSVDINGMATIYGMDKSADYETVTDILDRKIYWKGRIK